MKKIIYVGSFDPAHYGHKYILQKAEKKFKQPVEVCICKNEMKENNFLTLEERYEFAKYIFGDSCNISCYESYDEIIGLMKDAKYIVRGSRNIKDYTYCVKGGIHYNILRYFWKIRFFRTKYKEISSSFIRNELNSSSPNYEVLSSMIGKEGVEKLLVKKKK